MAEKNDSLNTVHDGNNEFAKHLYKILSREPGNLIFSPISVHAILSLISQGSANQTRAAFTHALKVSDLNLAAKSYKNIMSHLNSIKGVTLFMANNLFLNENYELQKPFAATAKDDFMAEVKLVDFSKSEAAASSINDWVEKTTNNKIQDIISADSLNHLTRLVLVNAIYFKGMWQEKFKPKRTATRKFYINDEDTIEVQMMRNCEEFLYKNDENLNAKVLQLLFVNNKVSLVVILPNERNGIAELEEKLAGVDLTKITENMRRREVYVKLPKFRIEQTIDLKEPLTEMGLGNIFTEDADFSDTIETSQKLCVSEVIQKVFIEVNEEGAEAAAATRYDLRECCYTPPAEFTANHPFIIVLQVRRKDKVDILFSGCIYEPKL